MKPKRPFTDLTEEGRFRVLYNFLDTIIRAMKGRISTQKALEGIQENLNHVVEGYAIDVRPEREPPSIMMPRTDSTPVANVYDFSKYRSKKDRRKKDEPT